MFGYAGEMDISSQEVVHAVMSTLSYTSRTILPSSAIVKDSASSRTCRHSVFMVAIPGEWCFDGPVSVPADSLIHQEGPLSPAFIFWQVPLMPAHAADRSICGAILVPSKLVNNMTVKLSSHSNTARWSINDKILQTLTAWKETSRDVG